MVDSGPHDNSSCPQQARLRLVLAGDPEDTDEWAWLVSHVEECDDCADLLERLDSPLTEGELASLHAFAKQEETRRTLCPSKEELSQDPASPGVRLHLDWCTHCPGEREQLLAGK